MSTISTASEFVPVGASRPGMILAPHADCLRIEGEDLVWSSGRWGRGHEENVRELTLRPVAFERFQRLREGTAEQILEFARRFGVLGLCHHGLPMFHAPFAEKPEPEAVVSLVCLPRIVRGAFHEPLESWRTLAREMVAVLRGSPMGPRRRALSINEWLISGGVQPRIFWRTPAFRLVLDIDNDNGPNLFGYLAKVLAETILDTKGLVICSGCRELCSPATTASPSRRNYCEDCRRDKKAQRQATQDYRARKREARAKSVIELGKV